MRQPGRSRIQRSTFRIPAAALAALLLASCAGLPFAQPAGALGAPPAPPAGGYPPPPAPCTAAPPPVAGAPVAPVRSAVLLAINDVYRIEGVPAPEGRTLGGLAHLRTLRRELEREHPDLLLLHAGDLLFPSLLSRLYAGRQMVDVLNDLDSDGPAFDDRLFVVFGNHELERLKQSDAAGLQCRLEESAFHWVSSNVRFALDPASGKPLVAAPTLARSYLVESGGIKIGIFGLTIDNTRPAYVEGFGWPLSVARRMTAELRREGAEVVVALTHLEVQTDCDMLAALGRDGPDLVVGGHEHTRQQGWAGGHGVFKADADAVTASVIHLDLDAAGTLRVRRELVPLDDAHAPPDPAVKADVDAWLKRHDAELCPTLSCSDPSTHQSAPCKPGCLADRLAEAKTELVGEETDIRRFETGFGDWLADLALAAYPPRGAGEPDLPRVAFLNSGSIRLNYDLPAASWITRRNVEEAFPYDMSLHLIEIDGATLQQVVDRAVADWTGGGHWLQVAGMAFRHDPVRGTATGLAVESAGGWRPVDPGEKLLAVVPDYLIDRDGDQDGYTMLTSKQVAGPELSPLPNLKTLTYQALRAAGASGVSFPLRGRICNPERPARCLAAPSPEAEP